MFSGYFDTKVDAKVETVSYSPIIDSLVFDTEEILYLSDIEKELYTARAVGMKTCWLVRDGDK